MEPKFTISVKIDGGVPTTPNAFAWVKVILNCIASDETGTYPSLIINVPVQVTADSTLAAIDSVARKKAKDLLTDALAAM